MVIGVQATILCNQIGRNSGYGISSPTISEGDIEHIIPVAGPLHERLLTDTPFSTKRERRVETLVLILTESVRGIHTGIHIQHVTIIIAVNSCEILTQRIGFRISHIGSGPHHFSQISKTSVARNIIECSQRRYCSECLSTIFQIAITQIGLSVHLI